MSTIVSYATLPHPDPLKSLVAVAVGDQVKVTTSRGRGLALEAKALLRALGAARRAGDIAHVVVSEELHAHLTGAEPPYAELAVPLEKLEAFLAAHPRTLVPAGQPSWLQAELRAHPDAFDPDALDLGGVGEVDAEWVAEAGATVVYSDGASNSEIWLGGWAYYVNESRYDSGPVPFLCTGFAAERYAAAKAIEAIPGPVLVVTDSWDILIGRDHYTAVQGIEDPLDAVLDARGAEVRFAFVKGHDDCLGNVAADSLATGARWRQVAAETADEVRARKHRSDVADLVDRTSEYRAARQAKGAWFRTRALEIIAADYPEFSTLGPADRSRVGREITLRSREEYNELHPAAPAEEPWGIADLLG